MSKSYKLDRQKWLTAILPLVEEIACGTRMDRNWPRQKIIFEVRMRGSNLRRLALSNGYCATTLYKALDRRWPHAHETIAGYLGVSRTLVWPEFYGRRGGGVA